MPLTKDQMRSQALKVAGLENRPVLTPRDMRLLDLTQSQMYGVPMNSDDYKEIDNIRREMREEQEASKRYRDTSYSPHLANAIHEASQDPDPTFWGPNVVGKTIGKSIEKDIAPILGAGENPLAGHIAEAGVGLVSLNPIKGVQKVMNSKQAAKTVEELVSFFRGAKTAQEANLAAKEIKNLSHTDAAAREALAMHDDIRAAAVAEASKPDLVGNSIRNQVKAAQKAKAPKPDVVGSSLRNRAAAEGKVASPKSAPIPETEFTPRDKFNIENRQFAEESKAAAARMQEPLVQPQWEPAPKGPGSELSLTREGDVITGQSPAPSPSPAPAPQAPASPVITAASPAPTPSPVATPTVAQETAGLEASRPGFFGRNKGKLIGGAATAGLAGAGTVGFNMARNADKSMMDKAAADLAAAQDAARQVKPPVGGAPGVPDPTQGEPPPPTGAAALTKQPSEQDIYDDELKQLQVGGIENLNDAANSIASAREASVDPQVTAAQQGVQTAIGDVNKQAEEKVPEREWNENLGLILASIGGGLSGDTQAPVRLSEVMRQGQRQRISDLQTGAEQKLRASQTGLDATLAGSRERLQRGEQRVGDVGRIAELRNAATKLAIEAQTTNDPRRRAQAEAQLALINSEIAKNRSSANYYESGAKVNKTMAETDKIRLENDRIKMINEIIEKNKKSPNRPSASK